MAKDFVKLSEVTKLEEVNDTASVLVEMNGEIYRTPKTQVGGANVGGIKTVIIQDNYYSEAVTGVLTPSPKVADAETYACINMTFEEAYEALINGEPLAVLGMFGYEPYCPHIVYGAVQFQESEQINFEFSGYNVYVNLRWTTDGLERYWNES